MEDTKKMLRDDISALMYYSENLDADELVEAAMEACKEIERIGGFPIDCDLPLKADYFIGLMVQYLAEAMFGEREDMEDSDAENQSSESDC